MIAHRTHDTHGAWVFGETEEEADAEDGGDSRSNTTDAHVEGEERSDQEFGPPDGRDFGDWPGYAMAHLVALDTDSSY